MCTVATPSGDPDSAGRRSARQPNRSRKMKRRLPAGVITLGFVSFCNDVASEMVVPLIPILLTTVLGAGPVALGLIEGIADAVAAVLKLWAGRHSDWLGGRRKALALLGYLLSNAARPLMALAGHWAGLLALRTTDRIGKGLRTAPRDALLADLTPTPIRGLAYGFHRALDNAGAVCGSLLAAFAFAYTPLHLKDVVLWSAVPGMLAVVLLAVGVREPSRAAHASADRLPPLRWGALPASMRRYLVALAVFTFARASEIFLILRGHELGMGVIELLLLWSAWNLAKAATASYGGLLSDRLGRARLIVIGWGTFACAFGLLAMVTTPHWFWLVTIVFGLGAGLAEGPERALVGDLAPTTARGTTFGWYHVVIGLTSIPAGLLFGTLWAVLGATFAFGYAAVLAAAALALMQFWVGEPVPIGQR